VSGGGLRRDTGRGGRLARAPGCDPVCGTPEFDGRPGQALPGFRVVEADPGRLLALRGRHRFSRYSLTFLLEDDRLRAQIHGPFRACSAGSTVLP
jgi:hypothetical protein